MDYQSLPHPPFQNRSLEKCRANAQQFQEFFLSLPQESRIQEALTTLWFCDSQKQALSKLRIEIEDFINKLLNQIEIKKEKSVVTALERFKKKNKIPTQESLASLHLLIHRLKNNLITILAKIPVPAIENLSKKNLSLPRCFSAHFFTEVYLKKGLEQALHTPQGPERTLLYGHIFQIALWDGLTLLALEALHDLEEKEFRIICIDSIESLFAAKTPDSLQQALHFLSSLRADSRFSNEMLEGAFQKGCDLCLENHWVSLTYFYACELENVRPQIHSTILHQAINDGEVEMALDYYDLLSPKEEALIEVFFQLDLSLSLELMEEISIRCNHLKNCHLKQDCLRKLALLFGNSGKEEAVLNICALLPRGVFRDQLIDTICHIFVAKGKRSSLFPLIELMTTHAQNKILQTLESLFEEAKRPDLKEQMSILKTTLNQEAHHV